MTKFFGALILALALVSCGGSEEAAGNEADGNHERVAKGSTVVYGNTLKISDNDRYVSLFPPDVVDAFSSKIISQIHDGLLKFDSKDLSILPAIAKDWKISDDQTIYTFELRDNVFFHDDPCFADGKGRKVTAGDFKFSFELLMNPEYSQVLHLFKDKVVGANDYIEGKADEISGIKVIDDHTLEITVIEPQSSFIYALALPNSVVLPKEGFDKYGKAVTVGAGAFVYIKEKDTDENLYLAYNPNYYMVDEEGNRLPYLDSVNFHYVPTKEAELEMFRTKDLSVLHGLPTSRIAEVVAENIANFKNKPPKTILVREPEMSTQYYEFNVRMEPFNNIKVRQAFNYAINREKLLNNVLNGQGTVGNKGITPKIRSFKGYDYNKIQGYEYNPELARQLLAEAGYPEGKNFPSIRLEVNRGGNVHKLVASEIQRQLSNTLGININVETVSFADKVEHSKYGKSEMFRSAWVADYPSPESFLSICYGGEVPESMDEPSHPNTMRYTSAAFDSLYLQGRKTANQTERYNLFAEAERIMMEDSPLMILWYQENYTLYHSEVRNFYYNAMEYMDFSKVYIKEMTQEEVEATAAKIESGESAPVED